MLLPKRVVLLPPGVPHPSPAAATEKASALGSVSVIANAPPVTALSPPTAKPDLVRHTTATRAPAGTEAPVSAPETVDVFSPCLFGSEMPPHATKTRAEEKKKLRATQREIVMGYLEAVKVRPALTFGLLCPGRREDPLKV